MHLSLRLKVALALFVAAVMLLAAQTIAVRTLAESQEERLIRSVIDDDMRSLLEAWRADPAALPPLDPALHARVSQEGGQAIVLPASVGALPEGVHEVLVGGREIHVVVARIKGDKLYRAYDYSAYEQHFKDGIDTLMIGAAVFVLPIVWLAYWLSGLLVRQVGGLAQRVRALRSGAASAIDPRAYDEREVAELAEALNDYHARMAAMIEREKEFTANVSHELRTPLTRIRTSCELLEPAAALLDAKSTQRLRQIEQAAQDMHAMIEVLLALAREGTAAAAPMPLAPAIESILERYGERLDRQGVRAAVAVPPDARILANAPALGIVLSNLLDNALRHTAAGGTIRIVFESGELCVEDTGSGIEPSALPHVFERFYRGPGESAEGFGIGLAIVKKICDRHGWRIGVESVEGSGTRVRLGLHENFTKT